MSSMNNTPYILFLVLNLVFFTFSSACETCPTNKPPPPPPKPKPCPPPPPPPSPKPKPCPPPPPPPSPKSCETCPTYKPPSTPATTGTCPVGTIKFGVCAPLLGIIIGTPTNTPCYTLIHGLSDQEAAVCLCSAIKANVLGIHLNLQLSLSLILNACSKNVPPGFQCA